MGFVLHVFGHQALFSRPELKTERYSYDVMTPSAARGIVEAIYWHPGLRYVIDKIKILSPIKRVSVRRNEVTSKINSKSVKQLVLKEKKNLFLNTSQDRTQRNSSILTDVDYLIYGHFEMTAKTNPNDSPGKFAETLKRRAKKGQCFKQPYFGCREFPASFEWVEDDSVFHSFYEDTDLMDFGIMLYDMDYVTTTETIDEEEYSTTEATPMFFHCEMKRGVIKVSGQEVLR